MMKSGWKWGFYIGYVLIAGTFFLYLLFPEEALKEYAQNRITRMRPTLSVSVKRLRPSFPPGLKMNAVSLRLSGEPLADFQTLQLSPHWPTLFSQNRSYTLRGTIYEGRLRGRFRVYRNTADTRISGDVQIQEIDIGALPTLRILPNVSFGGRLSGKILLNKKRMDTMDINARLEIAEASVELDVPLLPLKTLSFQEVQLDMKLHSRSLILRQMTAKGPQMDGRISGSIFISDNLKQSVLNLSGKIKPHHLLLAGIGKSLQSFVFSATKKKQEGIAFRISGTIENPRVSLEPS